MRRALDDAQLRAAHGCESRDREAARWFTLRYSSMLRLLLWPLCLRDKMEILGKEMSNLPPQAGKWRQEICLGTPGKSCPLK
eukprot:6832117-Prymnesium_polylepis.2